jgi:hypothetical protein
MYALNFEKKNNFIYSWPFLLHKRLEKMINNINKERRRSMNAIPIRPSKKNLQPVARSPGGPQTVW